MIVYGEEARQLIKDGVDTLANAVKVTLGPCGTNVIINKGSIPLVTKDGVTVAKSIVCDDNSKVGVDLIRSVSERTGNDAGDGTSSSSVLTQEIVQRAFSCLSDDPTLQPVDIKRGIDIATKEIVGKIKNQSVDASTMLFDIARISANNDCDIAGNVTKVIDKVGKTGMISIKPSDSGDTYIKYIEGLKWESGYLSPNFVTDPIKMEVEFTNAHIIIVEDKLDRMQTIVKELEMCAKNSVPVLIACRDIDQDVLNTLVLNNINKTIKCCVVRFPGFKDYRDESVLDLKAVIGQTELVDKVIVTKVATFIINTRANSESKKNRIESLKHYLELPEANVEDINKRIANISNSYATIFVGGNSEVEIQEKSDRYDDAVCAVRSAMEEGAVSGGGNTLNNIFQSWEGTTFTNKSIQAGYNVMYQSLPICLKQILKNGGRENLMNNTGMDIIYSEDDFITVHYALDYKVIDPTKVVRLVVENAASIAGAIVTTNCVII